MTLEYFDFAVQAIPPLAHNTEITKVMSYIVKALKHEQLKCCA
jgi:hypothetical protein